MPFRTPARRDNKALIIRNAIADEGKVDGGKWNISFDTKCQSTDLSLEDHYHPLSFPIYQSATFTHRKFGETTGFTYTRQSNPTRQQLESIMAHLENGCDAAAFASGMAAIGSFTTVDISREDITGYIRENTKAVYLETPTNPMMHVTDIEALSKITKAHGLKLIVDNTFLSPCLQNPLDLGADIVVHSGTKFIGGHHDTIGGFVVLKDPETAKRIRFSSTTNGSALSPFDSWLMIRGIRTLSVRMERACSNAQKLAEYLQNSPYVTRVLYPGLPDHPGHEIMKKQARGYGAMISFEVPSREFAIAFLENVELFYFAESLGGTETLITYPITQTHAEVPKELLDKNGITDRLLRLSVGIEGIDDLIAEFERVFAIAAKTLTK